MLLAGKPRHFESDGFLDAPSIINRDAIAELIETFVNGIPKVAALMIDFDPALRDAREPSHMLLSRLAIDPHALDYDGSPSDIQPGRPISTLPCA